MFENNRQYLVLSILAAICSLNSAQQIVDFTYSQYTHNKAKDIPNFSKISIAPDRNLLQDYAFPESCYSAKLLA